jgi:signal transduction histidine kinase
MGLLKKIVSELKFWEECKAYGLGLWQCPRFLFVVMGVITITAMIATHLIAQRYAEPQFVVASVVGMTLFLFIIGNIIVNSFEKIATANRMKTEFVSIVSHQLRTPLSSIKWSLDLLVSGRVGQLEKKQREYTDILQASNDRMIKLVNDLLNVTRIEQGRIILKKEKFDLGELADNLTREIKSFADASNVELEVVNNVKGSNIYADKQYVSMIFENLVDNAVRYINPKGKVSVSLERKGTFVRVEVKDNGVGIPKSEQRNIFQKFFRAQNIMRHRTEGSGLGLYLAKALVDLHKGKIGFSSKEGAGSTFWFELPIK